MNMKKIIMVLISMALVFTMAGAVSADDVELGSESSGTISTATVKIVAGLFGTDVLISFPDTIELSGSAGEQLQASAQIEIKKAIFETGYTGLNIKVRSDNDWNLMNDDGDECEYTMYQGGDPFTNGATILTVTGSVTESEPVSATYRFKTANTISESFATEVTDTLTFTVEYTYEE